ncbi:hypothetical protein ADUPG1_007936, partial [Aduncisulcus paluster]
MNLSASQGIGDDFLPMALMAMEEEGKKAKDRVDEMEKKLSKSQGEIDSQRREILKLRKELVDIEEKKAAGEIKYRRLEKRVEEEAREKMRYHRMYEESQRKFTAANQEILKRKRKYRDLYKRCDDLQLLSRNLSTEKEDIIIKFNKQSESCSMWKQRAEERQSELERLQLRYKGDIEHQMEEFEKEREDINCILQNYQVENADLKKSYGEQIESAIAWKREFEVASAELKQYKIRSKQRVEQVKEKYSTKLSEMATENTHLHAVIAKCVSRLKECFDMLRRTHDIRYSFDSIISSLQPLSFDSYSSGPSLQQPLTSGSPLFPAISFPALPQLISHPSSLPQV